MVIMRKILFLSVFCAILISKTSAQTTNSATLIKSLQERPTPAWFNEAKLGIFIHWGLYSVPAWGAKESYGEWFLKGLQDKNSPRSKFMHDTYGQNFTYNDFTNLFKAELFNPTEWADLFKRAGAKYVVLVSKHHDGYALWPSKYNRNWNSVDTGPKRDIVGELSDAVRKDGLKMGLYYSLPEWNNPLHRWDTDPHDSIATYVNNYMIPQFKELISTYKPSLVFADGEWFNTAEQWHSAELIDWYYKTVGPDAIVNDRWGAGIDVGFLTPEYSAGIKVTNRPWAEVRGIGRSFGLNRMEDLEAYGTSQELIQRFALTVANGGGMILNVGPKADGQIPMIQQERLVQLGNWLAINGEAIYGSRPFSIMGEEKKVHISHVDTAINFNWVRNSPLKGIKEDEFSIDWEGYLVAPESGKYTFEVKADDEAAIYIDGKLIINQNYTAEGNQSEVMGANTGKSTIGSTTLKKGEAHKIAIKYKEKIQNAEITLFWSSATIKKQPIPASSFFQDANKSIAGIKGVYSSLRTHIAYTTNHDNIYAISFDWPEDQLVLNIPNPGKNAKVKMLGLDKNLDWKYDNNKMVINTSSIKYADLPSHDAWTFMISKQ